MDNMGSGEGARIRGINDSGRINRLKAIALLAF